MNKEIYTLLNECKLQLEYLNEKFDKCTTTNTVLVKLNRVLDVENNKKS